MTSLPKSEPPPSVAPPSSMLPGRHPSAVPYVIGVVLLAGLIAVLVVLRLRDNAPPPEPAATASTAKPTSTARLPDFAPPPPTAVEEPPDAGSDAGRDAGKGPVARAPADGGACAACGKGVTTSELNSAVSSRAGMARGCYARTLRQGGAEGSIAVAVSVGNDGSVCGVSVASDTVGDPALTSCVVSKFRAGAFPRPSRGCVVLQVPISFKVK